MSSVKNEEMAKSSPDNPSAAYDKSHGKYKEEPSDTSDTAAAAMPLKSAPDPLKNIKGGSK